jgi:hypothetical protein
MYMLDLRQEGNRYYFKLGRGDDFWDTIRLLKNIFKPGEYTYNDETKEWSVPAKPVCEAKLCMIFTNAASCLALIKSQLPLFPQTTPSASVHRQGGIKK